MLYTTFRGNIYTIRGLQQESNTIIEYKNKMPAVTVEKAGLQICSSHPFLAASTDGIVTDNGQSGLLEIKNFLQTNTYLLKEAVNKVPNFCLHQYGHTLKLRKDHEIYYQVQGQLNIFEKDWCDFIVRRTKPYDMHIERIYRDPLLWSKHMVPKLEAFYHQFLLPELALPRYGTYTGIRQPKSPWFDPGYVENSTNCSTSQKLCKQKSGRKGTNVYKQKSGRKGTSVYTDALKGLVSTPDSETNVTGQCSTSQLPSCSSQKVEYDAHIGVNSTKCSTSQRSCKHKSITKINTVCTDAVKALQSTNVTNSNQPSDSSEDRNLSLTCGRSRRSRNIKFVGRKILHKCFVNKKKKKRWISGTVLDVIKGKDGQPEAMHEVLFEGEQASQEVNTLHDDFIEGSLKFDDI